MAGPSASTTEIHNATTTTTAITPPILTMPDELFVKTFEYLLTFDQPIKSIQTEGDAKLRAYNQIGLVQLNTSVLFLNRRLHKVANDVLHAQNCITLSIPTICNIHNPTASKLAKTAYRHVSLQISDARDPCDVTCVASCVRDLITTAFVQDRSGMTIELSQIHYTRYGQLAAALAKKNITLHFTAVGEAEVTNLSSVKMRFVWSDVYEAFKIMAGQKHEEIVPIHPSDVPLKLQQIKRKDPMTVQRLTCVLLKFHQREDVEEGSKWVEAEHTEREYERITEYAITGPDADVLWSEDT
ncbi:hypothetical protein LTR56_006201 [Elasticomyces elasticus]|nr:hypothetical protein LTR56_006201 [Elasticomyces elasticus]KAK3666590.1 hypothetical protein LTR22_002534 [Elasticomyces elasticus]KAK4928277.1 hypothetical protein LTR49_004954 [Elasticomyces elasticus]KAK5763840.1 hypothetical protein LTS12_005958 [Elasticomyces elasticus]